jgi:hypothetical protein
MVAAFPSLAKDLTPIAAAYGLNSLELRTMSRFSSLAPQLWLNLHCPQSWP